MTCPHTHVYNKQDDDMHCYGCDEFRYKLTDQED